MFGEAIEGLDDWLVQLGDIERRATQLSRLREEIHREILRQLERDWRIPDDTGRLRSSCLNPSDPDHVFEVDIGSMRVTVSVGSATRAARYQRDRIPRIDPEPILRIIGEFVGDGHQ